MANEPIIVAFGHRMQVGKDTAVEAIQKAYLEAVRYAFADALKIEVYDALIGLCELEDDAFWYEHKITPSLLPQPLYSEYSRSEKIAWINENKVALRHTLQTWGSEWRRTQDPLYWVYQLSKQIHADSPSIALISDMRFKNEFYWVKGMGGKTVNVVRIGRTFDSAHASENDLDGTPYDYTLAVPDGDIIGVQLGAVQLFEKIIKEKRDETFPRVSRFTSYGSLGGR